MTTISGIMCTWEEETMAPTVIEAVAPYIDELVVINMPGRDNTGAAIKNKCTEIGLPLKYTENHMKLRYARLEAFRQAESDWCLIVDGDEVYHTDGPAGAHTLQRLIEEAPRKGCVYRAPMNYLYLDFLHSRRFPPQKAAHKFFYCNDEKICRMSQKRNLPKYRGKHITLPDVYKFNCGIKPPDRILLRNNFLIEWRKRYGGELGFYEWVKKNTDYRLGVNTLEKLYNHNNVILYDEDKWGVRPKIIRDMIEKGVNRP